MQSNYAACLTAVLSEEGGYVNNPHDPGGPTNLGITQVTLSHELGRPASIADVKSLSVGSELVAGIYRKKFWNLIGGDHLPHGLDLIAFDIAVNSGPHRANEWLREMATIQPRPDVSQLINHLDVRRRNFWRGLKTWIYFGKGWFRREDRIYAKAIEMAHRAGVIHASL